MSDRVENLLALILIRRTKTMREKARLLHRAGFSNTEIADLLDTYTHVVTELLRKSAKR